jgi:hypothetical protein
MPTDAATFIFTGSSARHGAPPWNAAAKRCQSPSSKRDGATKKVLNDLEYHIYIYPNHQFLNKITKTRSSWDSF